MTYKVMPSTDSVSPSEGVSFFGSSFWILCWLLIAIWAGGTYLQLGRLERSATLEFLGLYLLTFGLRTMPTRILFIFCNASSCLALSTQILTRNAATPRSWWRFKTNTGFLKYWGPITVICTIVSACANLPTSDSCGDPQNLSMKWKDSYRDSM